MIKSLITLLLLLFLSTPLRAALIAYWPMDGNSTDSVGGHNGTDTDVTYVAGKFGSAASFNGTTSRINIGSATDIDNLGYGKAVTFAAWVNLTGWGESPGTPSSGDGTIFGKSNTSLSVDDAADTLNFATCTSGCGGFVEKRSAASSISTGSWIHVCTTVGTGTISATLINHYIGGSLSTPSFTFTDAATRNSDAGADAFLGNYSAAATGTFNGLIDEVRIYDSVEDCSVIAAIDPSPSVTRRVAPFSFRQVVASVGVPEPPAPPSEDTYYLALAADGGSDSNDGTSATDEGGGVGPWKTFAHALPLLNPGDTLEVQDGLYNNANGAGYVLPNCDAGYPDGEAGLPITITAENERQVTIENDSSNDQNTLRMDNCSYWTVNGLVFEQNDHDDSSETGRGRTVHVVNSEHINLTRNVMIGMDRYECDASVTFFASDDGLIQENEVYSFHRHGIMIQGGSQRNVVRRNYVNSRGVDKIGGTPCSSESAGIISYSGANSIMENNIVENVETCTQEIPDNPTGAASTPNNWYGNITKDCTNGLILTAKDPFGVQYLDGTIVRDLVCLGTTRCMRPEGGARNTDVLGVSSIDGIDSGFAALPCSVSPCGATPNNASFSAANLLVTASSSVSATGVSVSTANYASWAIDYANVFNYTTPYSPASDEDLTNASTTDPEMGTCIAWIPDSTPMKGAGLSGADLGANVLLAYEGGVLGADPLWKETGGGDDGDFVGCGTVAVGVNDVAGSSCLDADARLNINQGGCSFPSAYVGAP